ncbi:MAG: hypothetical protein ACFCUM_17775 [Bacteroidales bacterium]
MKRLINQTLYLAIASLLILLSLTTGCEKDDQGEPPEIPPLSSFVIDFSYFPGEEQKKSTVPDTYHNRNKAVFHIAIWNTVITVHMLVPTAAFIEAFNHQPQWQTDGTWKWSYSVPIGPNTYTANLFGEISGTEVEWNMYISKEGMGSFTDFLWYSGTSQLDGTEGTWTVNHSPADPVPYIGIEWFRSADETWGIKYINIVPEGHENGGYISHEITNNEPYDAIYEIYNKGKNNLVEINWNRTTKAGQIKDPSHYGNPDFHCWNEAGVDIACP